MKEEYESAISDYDTALKLDPKHSLAYANRGAAWEELDEPERALADYNEAIRLDPTEAWVFDNRGALLSDQDKNDLAMADFNEAIRLDKQFAPAYKNRADLRSSQGDFEPAIADYRQSLTLDPEDEAAWNALAWLRATCSDPDFRDGTEAIGAATRASELTLWQDGVILDTLAAAYAESGQFEQARYWQEKCSNCFPAKSKRIAAARLNLYELGEPYRQPLAECVGDSVENDDQ